MNKYCICKVLLDSRITPPNLPIFFNLRKPQNFILINSSKKIITRCVVMPCKFLLS